MTNETADGSANNRDAVETPSEVSTLFLATGRTEAGGRTQDGCWECALRGARIPTCTSGREERRGDVGVSRVLGLGLGLSKGFGERPGPGWRIADGGWRTDDDLQYSALLCSAPRRMRVRSQS